jgi:hypothetical protein
VKSVGLTLETAPQVADSWLFAKGHSSVRILRTGALSVAVCGPGRVRRFLSFLSNSDLVNFIRDTEYALATAGFRFRGFGTDRRQNRERRSRPRDMERRSPSPA